MQQIRDYFERITPMSDQEWDFFSSRLVRQSFSKLKVLDRDHKNGIHQGFMWIYNAPCDKLTLFDYRKGRDWVFRRS
jgi:hypothetical protein